MSNEFSADHKGLVADYIFVVLNILYPLRIEYLWI